MCTERYINPFTDFGFKNAFTEDERLAYEQSLKSYRDYNNTLQTAEWVGKEKGRAEGRAEGLAEGEKIGMEKGMEKGVEKVAINMLKQGIDIDTIATVTGLTADQIQSLK